MSDGPPPVWAHPPVEDMPTKNMPARTTTPGHTWRWLVIALFGVWSMAVWSVRVVNLWGDLLPTTEEKLWRTGLAATFIVLGLAVAVIGWGLRRWPATAGDRAAVGILAGWTVGVWASRTVELVWSEHEVVFVVVHLVLAAGSMALAWFAWRAVVTPAVSGGGPGGSGGEQAGPVPAAPGVVGTAPAGSGAAERAGSESVEERR